MIFILTLSCNIAAMIRLTIIQRRFFNKDIEFINFWVSIVVLGPSMQKKKFTWAESQVSFSAWNLSVVLDVVFVNFSSFYFLLQNHWVIFIQTWHKAPLEKGTSSLFRSPIYMIQGKWLRKSKNRGGSFKNIFIKNQITYIIQSLSFYRFLMYVRFKLICSIHDPQGLGRAPYY